MHELEKKLMESRIANARLVEDNESFQLLLSEKTLNGDFNRADLMHGSTGLGSLAEELESAEGESENYRRLELEAKSLKDQNKALTLYIENIIGRLLQHKEFENILDKTPDLMNGAPRPSIPNREKELPPPPPKETETAPSLLQRAKSVVTRSRPVSQVVPQASAPNIPSEEGAKPVGIPPSQSPSKRDSSHRRSQSDLSYAGVLVNQMYRGPPSGGSGGPMSPGFTPSGMGTRTSYFNPPAASRNPSSSSRTASASRTTQEQSGSSSNSTFSNHSAEIGSSSPPRTAGGITNNYPGAVMTQSKLRPLRLVQENQEMDGGGSAEAEERERELAARKKANRSSWIPGWMNLGKTEDGGARSVSAENGGGGAS